jgi:hypothetical protein
MSKFKVGDRVEIVKFVSAADLTEEECDEMLRRYAGKTYTVARVYGGSWDAAYPYALEGTSAYWCDRELRLATPRTNEKLYSKYKFL